MVIGRLFRRGMCRAGHHHPLACAGRGDHQWTWDSAARRWQARIVPASPITTPVIDPAARAAAVEDAQRRARGVHRPGGPR